MAKSTRHEKRLLRNLGKLSPDFFNKFEYEKRFVILTVIFNEYIEKVAIPKKWEFTKTLKQWPDGTGENEGIDEDGRIWWTEERQKLLEEVLNYPDFILFAMENYGLFIDSHRVENKENKEMPSYHAVTIEKVSKAEALSFCNSLKKEFDKDVENRPLTEKWDEREGKEDWIFDMIEKWDGLDRKQKLEVGSAIMGNFGKEIGLTFPSRGELVLGTDVEKTIHEMELLISEIIQKHRIDFSFFCITSYLMLPSYGKTKTGEPTMWLHKIPDQFTDDLIEALKAGPEDPEQKLKKVMEDIKDAIDKNEKNP